MDELSVLKRLDTVKAPPDFEQKLMARLSLRKGWSAGGGRRWGYRGRRFRFAPGRLCRIERFCLRQQAPVTVSKAEAGAEARTQQIIPVIETLDYGTEMRSRAPEPETIYLLEQVSDTAPGGIRY